MPFQCISQSSHVSLAEARGRINEFFLSSNSCALRTLNFFPRTLDEDKVKSKRKYNSNVFSPPKNCGNVGNHYNRDFQDGHTPPDPKGAKNPAGTGLSSQGGISGLKPIQEGPIAANRGNVISSPNVFNNENADQAANLRNPRIPDANSGNELAGKLSGNAEAVSQQQSSVQADQLVFNNENADQHSTFRNGNAEAEMRDGNADSQQYGVPADQLVSAPTGTAIFSSAESATGTAIFSSAESATGAESGCQGLANLDEFPELTKSSVSPEFTKNSVSKAKTTFASFPELTKSSVPKTNTIFVSGSSFRSSKRLEGGGNTNIPSNNVRVVSPEPTKRKGRRTGSQRSRNFGGNRSVTSPGLVFFLLMFDPDNKTSVSFTLIWPAFRLLIGWGGRLGCTCGWGGTYASIQLAGTGWPYSLHSFRNPNGRLCPHWSVCFKVQSNIDQTLLGKLGGRCFPMSNLIYPIRWHSEDGVISTPDFTSQYG